MNPGHVPDLLFFLCRFHYRSIGYGFFLQPNLPKKQYISPWLINSLIDFMQPQRC
jgi:hypothetical protein